MDYQTFEVNKIKMSVAKDDAFFYWTFENGSYWDWETLEKLEKIIDKNKNILEIGAHCGTSTVYYGKHCTNKKIIAFEPQTSMYNLLQKNIEQNDLKNVEIHKKAVFYKNDNVFMDDIDTHRIPNQGYNRGGISLGVGGEPTPCIKLDDIEIDDCGFLHVDAQGAEQMIFYSGLKFIEKHRPIILWENNIKYEKSLVDRVLLDKSIPKEVAEFDIDTALTSLGYEHHEKWSGIDTLSTPLPHPEQNIKIDISNIKVPTEAYIDIPANGLGCHITSMIMAVGWCDRNQKYLKYKPLPVVHHNSGNSNYNSEIEDLFGFKELGTPSQDAIKIPYEDIYFKPEYLPNNIDCLLTTFNKKKKEIESLDWVIHIRRNDISKTSHTERYIEIDKYNEVISRIRHIYLGKIHIFTDGTLQDIEGLTDKNLKIYFSNECKSLETFCKMSQCKNLVVGWSSFSYSAGIYNKNNVYHDILTTHNHNYYHPIPTHWKELPKAISDTVDEVMLKQDEVSIVGMCKNVALYLEQNVLRMVKMISQAFKKAYLYIYTNDNTDNTLEILQKFKKEHSEMFEDFTLEVESGITTLNRHDLTILVYGRNKCLDYARKNKTQYMAVVDLDDCLKVCDLKHIMDMKNKAAESNVVAVSKAGNKHSFGDKFSLRSDKFPKCIYKYDDHKPIWNDVLSDKLNEVYSYFGGLCIYNMANVPDIAKYSNMDKNGEYVCEHVAFNEYLTNKHYIYVCYT